MRITVAVFLLALEGWFALLNWTFAILLPIGILATVILWTLRRRRTAQWISLAWYGLLLVICIAAIAFRWAPRQEDLRTCSINPLSPKIVPQTSLDKAPVDPLQAFSGDVEQTLREMVLRAQAVRDRSALLSKSAKQLLADQGTLSSELGNAITALDESLQQEVQSSASVMQQRVEDIEAFVQQKRTDSLALTTDEAREQFRKQLDLDTTGKITLDSVYGKMRTVENIVATLQNDQTKVSVDFAIDATVEPTVKYIERISIQPENDGRVAEVDLLDLQTAAKVAGRNQQISIAYRAGAPTPLQTLVFTPADQDFAIIRETIESSSAEPQCANSRWYPMEQLLVRWPDPLPADIRVRLDRPAKEGSPIQRVSTRHQLSRSVTISEVRLPPDSFFLADYTFTASDALGFQSLKPSGENFTPEAFRRIKGITVQLLPNTWLLRNHLVQEKKHYLFVTNLAAVTIAALIGSAFGLVFLPKGKQTS